MSWSSKLILVAMALVTFSCAHAPRNDGEYRDSSFDDQNRAPASLQPPANAAMIEDRVDGVSNRTRADYYYSMGEALSFDGQHQKAVEAFRTVLVYDAEAPAVHLRLAAEYIKLGMVSESLESAQTALKFDPKNEDALLLLGGLYSTTKQYDQAIQQYEKVLAINPENTEAPMYLGAVYAEKKEYAKAVKYFERLAQNDDYQTPYLAYYYIGRIYADQGGDSTLKLAIKNYKNAIEKKPDHVDSVLALGQAYTKQGHVPEAMALYKTFQREQGPSDKIAEILVQSYLEQENYVEALAQMEILEKRSEDTLAVKVRIALLLIELKRYPQAAVKLTEVLHQVPDSDKIRFYLAAVYEEMGESDKAIENFRQVPAVSSFYSESVIHAAYLLKTQKKSEEALKVVQAGLEVKKDIPQFYSLAANLWDEKGSYDQAEKVLRQGLEQFADNVQLNFFLGTIYDRKGDKSKVIDQMRKVINMDPNHVQGLNYLAFTFAEMGEKLDEAEELAQRAMDLEPKDGFILDTYGWILFKQGHWSKAIPILERAHQFQPKESIIAEHLGDAYYKGQLVEKAKVMYEKALEQVDNKTRASDLEQKITAMSIQYKVRAEGRQPASVDGTKPTNMPNVER